MFLTFILAGIGFKQVEGLVDYAGIFQRLSIIIGWTWISLLSLKVYKNPEMFLPGIVE